MTCTYNGKIATDMWSGCVTKNFDSTKYYDAFCKAPAAPISTTPTPAGTLKDAAKPSGAARVMIGGATSLLIVCASGFLTHTS